MSLPSISEQLAHYCVRTTFESPEAAEHRELFQVLNLSLMDWCCVGRAGMHEPVSQIVRKRALADEGQSSASIFGSTKRLPARAAAQVNGTTTHALDYDDTHFLHVGHTSVVVFSAAFAVAEAQAASWSQLMNAALIGSETCCHVGAWLGRSHYQAGFHQTATAGIFGATATAARLLQLDYETTRHALGLASTMASGLTSQFGTMGKPFHAGMAAANGVEAAMLAAAGFTSNPDGLECAQGFASSHHGNNLQADNMFKLGSHYVFSDVQHKYHACCHGLHASLEALDALRQMHAIESGQIKRIAIHTNPRWLNVCNVASPQSGLESKFSYRHTAALLFSDYDTAALHTYSDAVSLDTQLHTVRDKTTVIADTALSDTQTRVQIELESGKTCETTYDLASPLPLAERQEKLLSKCTSLTDSNATRELWSLIENAQDTSVRDFAAAVMSNSRTGS